MHRVIDELLQLIDQREEQHMEGIKLQMSYSRCVSMEGIVVWWEEGSDCSIRI